MKQSHSFMTLLAAASLLCGASCSSQAGGTPSDEFFTPYESTDLRAPSVPLVVNDPYFSIWSPYDKLTDGTTRHWTNDEKPLEGLLTVDGTVYRWMGAERFVLKSIAPMADEEAWEADYSRAVQRDGWQRPDFQPTGWQRGRAAWGSDGLDFVRTHWSDLNSDLYVRRSVNLTADDLKEDLWLVYSHDDVFELFVNGTKVADTGETWREGIRLPLDGELKALLKEARGVVREGGFDIEPLRKMIAHVVDEDKIRQSDVDFFIMTYSLSDMSGRTLKEGKHTQAIDVSTLIPGRYQIILKGNNNSRIGTFIKK